jgi:hypothetical protein
MSSPTEGRAFATIAYEVADAIATVTLDRPDRLNALDPTMERELLGVWDLVDADDAVRAVVVTEAPVDHDGRFYRLRIAALDDLATAPQRDIPIYTAGMNRRMIEAAGRVADGLLGHTLFSPRYVTEVVLSPPTSRVRPDRVAENLATLIAHCAPGAI